MCIKSIPTYTKQFKIYSAIHPTPKGVGFSHKYCKDTGWINEVNDMIE